MGVLLELDALMLKVMKHDAKDSEERDLHKVSKWAKLEVRTC